MINFLKRTGIGAPMLAAVAGGLFAGQGISVPAPGNSLVHGPQPMPPVGNRSAGRPAAESPQPRSQGSVFILSAPSGTGKSTLARKLLQQVPDLVFGVSHTTRAPRPGEVDGVDYVFVSDAVFDAMVAQGRFAEWVGIYGHRYGLVRDWMLDQLSRGKDLLLDLDTTGARALCQTMPEAVTVFLLPPSAQELSRRLRGRGSETEAQLTQRLGQARRELSRFADYDYLVVGRTVEQAFKELEAIILATRARQSRMRASAQKILEGF